MTDSPVPTPHPGDTAAGFAFALSAYLFWGLQPLYMKALAHIPAAEVILHRVIWSIPVAGLVLVLIGRTADLKAALRSPRTVAMAALCAAIVSVNWGIYVWAIAAGYALDTALGYYINPLFSVALGALFLGERLSRLQVAAIALAAAAVVILTVANGRLPLIALSLTVSWGAYAFLKRTLPIGPNQGFFLEVLILAPAALAYWLWLVMQGQSHFATGDATDTMLLLGLGIVTATPLMLYANGAKRLKLSTIGMMQYIAPTMIFLLAVFVFGEPFSVIQGVAFGLIWAGLALYSAALLRNARKVAQPPVSA
jgi:chloramphenicol-sensitive protein RarD